MRRTNIYLDDRQLESLQQLGKRRGVPVAVLVREAVTAWLEGQGVQTLSEDEWQRRFDALLGRRRKIALERAFSEDQAAADVALAVREVRKARAARRR